MDRKTMDLWVGVFVVAGVLALGLLAFKVGNLAGESGVKTFKIEARFDNIGAIGSGADVRIGGVKVGSVTGTSIDPQTFQAILSFTVQGDLKLPTDSSATISSGGLLGGGFVSVTPGGADAMLGNGGTVTITQSATNLEDLLGKFIFNVGSLADATQKSLKERQPGQGQ